MRTPKQGYAKIQNIVYQSITKRVFLSDEVRRYVKKYNIRSFAVFLPYVFQRRIRNRAASAERCRRVSFNCDNTPVLSLLPALFLLLHALHFFQAFLEFGFLYRFAFRQFYFLQEFFIVYEFSYNPCLENGYKGGDEVIITQGGGIAVEDE